MSSTPSTTTPTVCVPCCDAISAAEARDAVRRTILTYFAACDVPTVIDRSVLAGLFDVDARWEGIGRAFSQQFGALVGRDAILEMLEEHLGTPTHYAENAHVVGDGLIDVTEPDEHSVRTATGQWLMQQTLVAPDGQQETRASRITASFRVSAGTATISRFSTERLARVVAGPASPPTRKG